MLEPYEGKLSRAVLRGEGGSNTPDLPDDSVDVRRTVSMTPKYRNIAQMVKASV